MTRLSWFKRRYFADPDPIPPEKLPDVALLAQLWADQFQHLTTLALAGGGGLLVLLQTGIVEVDRTFWIALVLFSLMATLSLIGQTAVVDDATRGLPPGKHARITRGLAMMVLGAAAYAAIDVLT